MTAGEKVIYNRVIDELIAYINLHKKYVRAHQVTFADELNKKGVNLFFKRNFPVAKAYFWVSRMLGNRHASRNWLCEPVGKPD